MIKLNNLIFLPILALIFTACPGGPVIPTSLATQIDAGSTNSDWTSFDTDPLGNAIVVWQQSDGTANRIYANRSLGSNKTWQGPIIIDAGATNTSFSFGLPKVGLDAQGNATAVWTQVLKDGTRIYANQFSVTTNTWGTPVIIDAGGSGAGSPSIAVDAKGYATVVWEQYNSQTSLQIFSNRWNPNLQQWEGAIQIDSTDQLRSRSPIIRADALGNVVAVWVQINHTGVNSGTRLYTAWRAPNQIWSTPKVIDAASLNGNYQVYQQIAFDALGNAMVVWVDIDALANDSENIYGNYYDLQKNTWKGAERVNLGQTKGGRPQIAFDASGNAVAVWSNDKRLDANRFNGSTKTWDTFKTIRTSTSPYLLGTNLVFDKFNQARVIWFENSSLSSDNNTFDLNIATLSNETFLLGTPTLIQQARSFNWESPTLKLLSDGMFFTAFNQSNQSNVFHSFAARLP
jgi:hypothetical protein